jgi:hypothetical protein
MRPATSHLQIVWVVWVRCVVTGGCASLLAGDATTDLDRCRRCINYAFEQSEQLPVVQQMTVSALTTLRKRFQSFAIECFERPGKHPRLLPSQTCPVHRDARNMKYALALKQTFENAKRCYENKQQAAADRAAADQAAEAERLAQQPLAGSAIQAAGSSLFVSISRSPVAIPRSVCFFL